MKDDLLRRARAPLAPINLTPLIDVLLVLVGVLLVLAPNLVKRLPVELPRTTLNGTPVVMKELQIGLSQNGTMFLNGHVVSLEDVKTHITPGETAIQLGADKRIPYGTLVAVVNSLRSTDPRQIVLITQ